MEGDHHIVVKWADSRFGLPWTLTTAGAGWVISLVSVSSSMKRTYEWVLQWTQTSNHGLREQCVGITLGSEETISWGAKSNAAIWPLVHSPAEHNHPSPVQVGTFPLCLKNTVFLIPQILQIFSLLSFHCLWIKFVCIYHIVKRAYWNAVS